MLKKKSTKKMALDGKKITRSKDTEQLTEKGVVNHTGLVTTLLQHRQTAFTLAGLSNKPHSQ
jgi:hypothetical protein